MKRTYSHENRKEGIAELTKILQQSTHTVVLTGAGMDTESNIPDFRGKNGLWKNIDPRVVADIRTLRENYKLFHEFYKDRLKNMESVRPHPGHYVLAELEKRGVIKSITTQNISGLHAKAGSKNIYELHGNMKEIFCNNCGGPATEQDMYEMKPCRSCNEVALRPNVVLFGEMLPDDVWQAAISEIKRSDLFIIIGTSLEVSPVNQLPYLAQGRQVFINNEDRGAGYSFDLTILGQAKEILKQTMAILD